MNADSLHAHRREPEKHARAMSCQKCTVKSALQHSSSKNVIHDCRFIPYKCTIIIASEIYAGKTFIVSRTCGQVHLYVVGRYLAHHPRNSTASVATTSWHPPQMRVFRQKKCICILHLPVSVTHAGAFSVQQLSHCAANVPTK
jgi:hypothetical protein